MVLQATTCAPSCTSPPFLKAWMWVCVSAGGRTGGCRGAWRERSSGGAGAAGAGGAGEEGAVRAAARVAPRALGRGLLSAAALGVETRHAGHAVCGCPRRPAARVAAERSWAQDPSRTRNPG